MDSVLYILSDAFDYSRMICDDAGPAYARRMGWTPVRLSEADAVADRPRVVDNRLPPEEMPALRRHVLAHPRFPVFLKLVDPQLETVSHHYVRSVLGLLRHRHVSLLGPYRKTGLTALAEEIAGRDLYHPLPYAYDPRREQPLDTPRRPRLFLSGALSPSTYPDRWRLYRKTRRHPLAWLYIARLRHPGYADVGMRPVHRLTGDAYLAEAARHRLMWVDPSAYGLELLKFTECAYAGCAPAGVPASTLPAAAREAVIPLPPGEEIPALRRHLALPPAELRSRALRYREALRAARDPAALTRDFLAAWSLRSAELSASPPC